MKNMAEAFHATTWANEHPENARAWGVEADAREACAKVMQKQDYREDVIDKRLQYAHEQFARAVKVCESPIECAMLAGLLYADYGDDLGLPAQICLPGDVAPAALIIIYPQFQLSNYRLDFLVGVNRLGLRSLINVECDGHEFHENVSRPAWEKDRVRDAFVSKLGIRVHRFTGSAIWKDAQGCADELIALLPNRSATNGAR